MKFYRQTRKTNCGQIAVANLTGRSIEDIEAMVGHGVRITTKELSSVLRSCGFQCDDRLHPISQFKRVPERCLAKLTHEGRSSWHWIAIMNGDVYDGLNEFAPVPFGIYTIGLPPYRRITSFLSIFKQTEPQHHAAEPSRKVV